MSSLLPALFCLLAALPLFAQQKSSGHWQTEDSHTTAGLRGIHNAGAGVAWASGTDGTVLRTEDGGYLWQTCAIPPDAAKLDFRGVWAWDAQTAVVMSSGTGNLSRVYKTTDGCGTWKLLYTNPDPTGFWDAIAFWDRDEGVIVGDPINGVFTVLEVSLSKGTLNAKYYRPFNIDARNVSAFAASNSALVFGEKWKQGDGVKLWIGTGGKGGARVLALRTHNAANAGSSRWTTNFVPLASGNESSGVFSLAFRDQLHGIAVGGDYTKPDQSVGAVVSTADGGGQWTTPSRPPHGYRSAVAWDATNKAWIAAGTNGSDVSYDDGKTWQSLDDANWNALSLPWVVGPKGRIAKLVSLKDIKTAHDKTPKITTSKSTAAP